MDGVLSIHWHHIPRSSNPADCASRGLYPIKLANHVMWWEGPSWLRLSTQDWPSSSELDDCPRPDEEKISTPETALAAVSELSLLNQISSYSCLQRVTAWLLRFVTNSCISQVLRMNDHHFGKQLTDAEIFWVKTTKLAEFSSDQIPP